MQESLAELALLKNAETGQLDTKTSDACSCECAELPKHVFLQQGRAPQPVPVHEESTESSRLTAKNGGESAQLGGVPRIQKIRTNVTPGTTEVIIDLEDSVQYSSGKIANPDRIYFDLHAARLSSNVAYGNVAVSGDSVDESPSGAEPGWRCPCGAWMSMACRIMQLRW